MDVYLQLAIDIAILLMYSTVLFWICFVVFKLFLLWKEQLALDKTIESTIMLEIKLPRIITKSPESFDMIAAMFVQGGGVSNSKATFWDGAKPAQFSLEIASIEGVIHFYIRTHKKFKDLLTANIYAHYPGIEVVEAQDYTKLIKYEHRSKDIGMWGIHYNIGGKAVVGKKIRSKVKGESKILSAYKKGEGDFKKMLKEWTESSSKSVKALADAGGGLVEYQSITEYSGEKLVFLSGDDKQKWADEIKWKNKYNASAIVDAEIDANLIPIKTYVDFGHDKNPDEEYKHDPLVPILEFMGMCGPGEHLWYQIILQDEGVHNDKKFPKLFSTDLIDTGAFTSSFGNKKEKTKYNFSDLAQAHIKWMKTKVEIHFKGESVQDDFGYDKPRSEAYQVLEDSKELDADGAPIKKLVTKKEEVTLRYAKNIYKEGAVSNQEIAFDTKDTIDAIGKKISKPLLRATIRVLHVYDRRKSKSQVGGIQFMLSMFKNFAGGASFIPGVSDPYDYPNDNTFKRRTPWRHEELFEAYVEREAFFPHIVPGDKPYKTLQDWEDLFFFPYPTKFRKIFRFMHMAIIKPWYHPSPKNTFVLNTEEIATLYHFPGEVAAVPTLPRIDSVKGSLPDNIAIVDENDIFK